MKLTLAFPPPAQEYRGINSGHEDTLNNPPPSGLAVLASYVRDCIEGLQVTTLPDQKPVPGGFAYREVDEMARQSADADCVGIACWFSNMPEALRLARLVKEANAQARIVLGGPNVRSAHMARLILSAVPEVHAVVRGDGEESLLRYLRQDPSASIPNLETREHACEGESAIDMNAIPLWDFRQSADSDALLDAYDVHAEAYRQSKTDTMVPRIGIAAVRGCIKAHRGVEGGRTGRCDFCTSGGNTMGVMRPERYYDQIAHLHRTHGVQDFLESGDVFAISPQFVAAHHAARMKRNDLPSGLRMRGYAYPIAFDVPEGRRMAEQLRQIGFENMFLGVETVDASVSACSNKDAFSEERIIRSIEACRQATLDTTIALLLGLPGESANSLRKNRDFIFRLVDRFGSKESGKGNLTRIDLSKALPLVGSKWFERLLKDPRVCLAYNQKTKGRVLARDIAPDYDALFEAALFCQSDAKLDQVLRTEEEIVEHCKDVLVWGGFYCKRR